MLAVAFGVAAFLNAESPTMLMNAMFCLAGIGWATINVNSFPMVVEMCSGSDVGRYTGFTTRPAWPRRSSRRCSPVS